MAATDSLSHAEVKRKCQVLFRQWAVDYISTPGMERIVALHKQLPQRKKPVRQEQSKVLKETEPEANEDPFGNTTSAGDDGDHVRSLRPPISTASSSSKSISAAPGAESSPSHLSNHLKKKYEKHGKKPKTKPFNLEKEKPQLLQTIASASVASTNLMNSLKLINREKKRISEDQETVKRFENCKMLRRQILRYIEHVESEQWLGSLIHANEELVNALMAYEVLDKSLEDDSDSEENEWDEDAPAQSKYSPQKAAQEAFAGLSVKESSTRNLDGKLKTDDNEGRRESMEEDDDDPFADTNAVQTPKMERPGFSW